jgi:hypothetical protein
MSTVNPLKFCTERSHLLDLVNLATAEYAKAATDLAGRMATMPEAAYKLERAAVEQARRDAQHARAALLQHQREHGC